MSEFAMGKRKMGCEQLLIFFEWLSRSGKTLHCIVYAVQRTFARSRNEANTISCSSAVSYRNCSHPTLKRWREVEWPYS